MYVIIRQLCEYTTEVIEMEFLWKLRRSSSFPSFRKSKQKYAHLSVFNKTEETEAFEVVLVLGRDE